jgi:hypothetical protein
MTTFGEISWNDEVYTGGSKKESNKDVWLKLDEGSNELRLITQPFQFLVHKYKKDDSDKFGQKVYCSAIHGSCPLCDMGDKAKPRWLLGVISRKTGTYKILDISYAVFSQVRKYAKSTKWGDPTKYDLDIVVDKQGGATGYYSVQPIPKEPLSAADQKIKDDVDLDELKRKVTPPTADLVQKRIDKINGGTTAANTAGTAKPAVAAKAPVVSMTEDEDINESFPSYDGDAKA